MLRVSNGKEIETGTTTFSEPNFKESRIEELLRKNFDIICDEKNQCRLWEDRGT